MAVTGAIVLNGRRMAIESGATESGSTANRAWLDHEWSEAILHPEAVGWDWIGMNLQDGRALTAFRLRRRDGSTLWSGGSLRTPGQPARIFTFPEVRFTPGRTWQSPASGARYPVEWTVDTPAGRFQVRARLDAQELDSRGSTGARNRSKAVPWDEGMPTARPATMVKMDSTISGNRKNISRPLTRCRMDTQPAAGKR